MKRIIVHIPYQILTDHPSGTQIRPLRMKKAFEEIGYEVDLVEGVAAQRKIQMARITAAIRSGERYEFMYTECSTEPTLLTEPNHLPLYPFLDFGFFRFCRNNGIKIGLFYRDIYWNFPFYGESLPLWKKLVARFFYRYDLRQYQKYLDVFYLPSREMLPYVPANMGMKVEALPPGACFEEEMKNTADTTDPAADEPLHILYVGGIGSVYRIHLLLAAVKERPQVMLTICCRKEEWEAFRSEYETLMAANIRVVHQSGEGLTALYREATVVSIFIEPSEYRNFAMPIKLFEYIKFEKPVISTNQTAVGEFVSRNDIGWSIPYDSAALLALLDQLDANKDLIRGKVANVRKIRMENTWEARAKKVAGDLMQA